jgi:hypothetical protein
MIFFNLGIWLLKASAVALDLSPNAHAPPG